MTTYTQVVVRQTDLERAKSAADEFPQMGDGDTGAESDAADNANGDSPWHDAARHCAHATHLTQPACHRWLSLDRHL